MSAHLRLLRPKQWTKNLLLFAAILFTNNLSNPDALSRTLMAFVAMCLISSAVYVFNDVKDVEKDRNHPVKKSRPIASGAVGVSSAVALGLLCALAGGAIVLWLGAKVAYVVLAYVIFQVLYNLGAKSVPVLDVFVVASGFVIRAMLGAAAIDVKVSGWLLLCTGALALMLGFGKRRHEFVLQGEQRATSRASLAHYSRESLDSLVLLTSAAAALCYGIYALESPTAKQYPGLILTALFVFYGISRYTFLIFAGEGGEPENLLFRDPHMIFTILLFVASAILALSGVAPPLIDFTGDGR
ncbi:MAG TPA: decaprenyl-phosphate phosphoribosyltransferase [Fimbriimonadaceae bacterium]|nr:decaprenyl-phosphate phosphoribosyltransferase [Fimbriimonadaceae bacterium]